SYQDKITRQGLKTLGQVVHNFGVQLRPVLSYFDDLSVLPHYLMPFALVLVLSTVLLWLATCSESPYNDRRRLTLMLCCAAGGVVLAILPYISFPAAYRTQLFAAPMHAALWAMLIGLIGTLFPGSIGRGWLAIAGSVLIAASTVHSLHFQD